MARQYEEGKELVMSYNDQCRIIHVNIRYGDKTGTTSFVTKGTNQDIKDIVKKLDKLTGGKIINVTEQILSNSGDQVIIPQPKERLRTSSLNVKFKKNGQEAKQKLSIPFSALTLKETTAMELVGFGYGYYGTGETIEVIS